MTALAPHMHTMAVSTDTVSLVALLTLTVISTQSVKGATQSFRS